MKADHGPEAAFHAAHAEIGREIERAKARPCCATGYCDECMANHERLTGGAEQRGHGAGYRDANV